MDHINWSCHCSQTGCKALKCKAYAKGIFEMSLPFPSHLWRFLHGLLRQCGCTRPAWPYKMLPDNLTTSMACSSAPPS